VPGDIILLVGGTIVPADTKWVKGDRMQIDTAAMTGEPLPRKYPSPDYGDIILAGTTVMTGECYGQVILTGTNTEVGKAQADILKDKSVRVVSVFQEKIMSVVQILISSSFLIVAAVLLVEGIVYDGFDNNVKETILDALSIMIASIPVALPLVVQVNLALGASFLAKEHNAIVTSIPALQDIASMSMLCR
jgi:H+-transporting ATPase